MGTEYAMEPRTLRPEEFDPWWDHVVRAFGGGSAPAEERALDRSLTEFERSMAVWDTDAIVGTAGAFSFRMTVPGGAVVPTAGVTMVSVSATHRRRGVLRSMMRRLLDEAHAKGEPLAALFASEPAIYGRFGFGAATQQLGAEIDTARVGLELPEGTDEVRVRYVSPAEALAECEAVYAALVPGRPGMLSRQPGWERAELLDPESGREGASALQCVLAERGGEVTGFARFRTRMGWGPSGHDGTVTLETLAGLDPATEGALWRFLFGIDLMTTLSVRGRPVDDAWQHQVSDVRRCLLRLRDAGYARLVDVGAALSARTYLAPVDVVFEVEDDFCPWNAGRWRLTGDTKGASCERTEDAADLALSVRELGSAYLGGVSLLSLAAAGRVRELRSGALTEASVAFGSAVAPWLPHGF
ncbi:GNAT family N-acetyltransferase [Streptomyces sp. LP11]|uniref:GNAT family N-acetyltransferase n=1 Tax=Streptomyces pyxinicus TaxID=2970331 RepID=A0ABT2BCW2_9ACTN|nr:GNAT family N-acetyltransferase [Streptomyces sp. LP11]MCS0606373.1 GNAT family N-acetyltransferase [Streptomyces sp. LP11]